ncbi:MAG: hypothetical protein H0W88_05195 [Parachlamydiaceae bacterium]|nr:hypothetical protein [Parachlamydiaceae bacterium]
MVKLSFIKIENIFTETLRKMMIDRLSELATIVTLMNDPNAKITEKTKSDIIHRFQNELKRMKEHDLRLYKKLKISKKNEGLFFSSMKDLSPTDWKKIKMLRDRIDVLKQELYGIEVLDRAEYEIQVEKERKKHINKRFNIKDGWLPLR